MATEGYPATHNAMTSSLPHQRRQRRGRAIARRLRVEAQWNRSWTNGILSPAIPGKKSWNRRSTRAVPVPCFLVRRIWDRENEEMRLALDKRTRNPAFRVIPVLLPNTQMPEKDRYRISCGG